MEKTYAFADRMELNLELQLVDKNGNLTCLRCIPYCYYAKFTTNSLVFVSISHGPSAISGSFNQPTTDGFRISTASRYVITGIGSISTYVPYALVSRTSFTGNYSELNISSHPTGNPLFKIGWGT